MRPLRSANDAPTRRHETRGFRGPSAKEPTIQHQPCSAEANRSAAHQGPCCRCSLARRKKLVDNYIQSSGLQWPSLGCKMQFCERASCLIIRFHREDFRQSFVLHGPPQSEYRALLSILERLSSKTEKSGPRRISQRLLLRHWRYHPARHVRSFVRNGSCKLVCE